jgi:hypothetical protein
VECIASLTSSREAGITQTVFAPLAPLRLGVKAVRWDSNKTHRFCSEAVQVRRAAQTGRMWPSGIECIHNHKTFEYRSEGHPPRRITCPYHAVSPSPPP